MNTHGVSVPASDAPAAEPAADQPLLDRAASLARVGDDLPFLGEMIDLYLAHDESLLARVRDACGRGDAGGLKQACHVLKSQVLFFGAAAVAETLGRLQRCAAAAEVDGVAAELGALERQLHALRRQLQALREEATREGVDR